MKKLPKIVYIQQMKEDNDTEYLLAWDCVDEADDGTIGIYELKETKNKSTKVVLS